MTLFNTNIRNNLSLAWPLALNAVLMQSMLLIDTLLVAPLGALALASMGIATTIMAFVLGIQSALASGTQLIVGRAKGSESRLEMSAAFWCGLLINTSAAAVFWCILTLLGPELLSRLADDPALIDKAESYLSIIKYIVIVTAFTQVCTAFFNGRGNTKIPFKSYLLELPFNAFISYFLINGLGSFEGLGVEGAAWGSLTAILVRLLFLFYALKEEYKLDFGFFQQQSFTVKVCHHFFEIIPIAANFMLLALGATVYQLLYAQLNLYSYVAITLVFPWIRIGTQFITAWAQASAITISQAIGQKQTGHLKFFVTECTRVAFFASIAIAMLFYALSQSMDLIYRDISPETRAALAIIAPLYIFLPIIRTYNTICGHILRSVGKSVQVLKISFVTQWLISIPVCALLIIHYDISIFWAFAMIPIEELIKSIPLYRLIKLSLSNFDQPKLNNAST